MQEMEVKFQVGLHKLEFGLFEQTCWTPRLSPQGRFYKTYHVKPNNRYVRRAPDIWDKKIFPEEFLAIWLYGALES